MALITTGVEFLTCQYHATHNEDVSSNFQGTAGERVGGHV